MAVTHHEHVQYLPAHFGRKILDAALPRKGLELGCAVVIDCVTKTVSYLSS